MAHDADVDAASTTPTTPTTPRRRPRLLSRGLSSPYAPLPPSDWPSLLLGLVFQLYTILLEPLLFHLGLTTPGGRDATYGRASIPLNAWEQSLVYANPCVRYVRGRAPLGSDALRAGGSWDRAGTGAAFVSYTVFWIPEAVEREGLNADVLLLHGINDYGGKLVPHGYHFARAGFRVVVLDLPSFGRSSGLHAYLPSMRILVEAVHSVLFDLGAYDAAQGTLAARRRKLFLEGHSMGGFTALYYAAVYPPHLDEEGKVKQLLGTDWRPQIDGVAVAAPMIGISKESRPSYAVELLARTLRFFLSRLPVASAVRGNVSDDPRVEDEFHLDPMTYKGRLRIGTGLAVLEGLRDLDARVADVRCAVSMHHGDCDRATSWRSSRDFFDRLPPSPDNHFTLWKGYEHVMMKNVQGQSKEDDQKRDDVLDAITRWLVTQASKDG